MRRRSDLGNYAHGQFAVDYESRVDHRALLEARVQRTCVAMSEAGLDAVLVWKDENVRFLSGLRAQIIQGKSALLNGCLLTVDRGIVLFLSGGEVDRARNVMTWIDEIHAIPIMEARNLIAGTFDYIIAPVIGKLGLDRTKMGLDQVAFSQLEEFRRTLPDVTLADGDAIMQSVRLIKTPDDIALMQEAAAVAEAVTEAAIRAVRTKGAAQGFADNFLSLFIGHGIGMGSNEPPYVGESLHGADTVRLEAGMTMALEPLIWLLGVPGGGGVRLEDTVLVGAEGGIPLTRAAFDERLLLE